MAKISKTAKAQLAPKTTIQKVIDTLKEVAANPLDNLVVQWVVIVAVVLNLLK